MRFRIITMGWHKNRVSTNTSRTQTKEPTIELRFNFTALLECQYRALQKDTHAHRVARIYRRNPRRALAVGHFICTQNAQQLLKPPCPPRRDAPPWCMIERISAPEMRARSVSSPPPSNHLKSFARGNLNIATEVRTRP